MAILGIDLSLIAPGYAVLNSPTKALLVTSQRLRMRGPERWEEILRNIKAIIENHVVEMVYIEGYAFDSKFQREDMGEIGGIIRYFFYKRRIPYACIPPSTLKKFFTGSGRADKNMMMRRAFELGFKCDNDNESDAVALALFGIEKGYSELKSFWIPKATQSRLNL